MSRRGLPAAVAGLIGLAIVGFALQGPAATDTAAIPGTRPSYAPAALSVVPNEAATTRRIWMPGLDEW